MEQKNIVLIGMPGAGKSTVGVLLAKAMGREFVDTDLLIQSGEKATLSDLIGRHGLAGFCDIERRYAEGVDVRNAVIATGGSAVYYESAMRHLKENGIAVYLELPLEQRVAIVMRDIEGLSYEEIAETLKLSLGTVKSRIARGRELLKRRFNGARS